MFLEKFNEIFTFCYSIPRNDLGFRYISKKDLLAFLCKLKQGLSDEFPKVIFNYPSRQAVSLTIRKSLDFIMIRFVPNNIGFRSIIREHYVTGHVIEFANELYNENPKSRRAIAIIDATYANIDKRSHFRSLRRSYCLHKNRHLIKPILIVAPDGYILDVQEPHFSDFQYNDS